MSPPARLELDPGGRVARLVLASPPANVLDRAMVTALDEAATGLTKRGDLAAVVVIGEGPNFSFGASVEEHLPGEIEAALGRLHALLRRLLDLPAPTVAAVRGHCLGGGLELALACDLIVAEDSAWLGLPEIKLAVFPPAASALLPARIGAGPAAELILTGESWSAAEAARRGLVSRTVAAGELAERVDDWIARRLVPLSPAALAHATRAVRRASRRALDHDLPELERAYLSELMSEPDAVEGLQAFLAKRKPRWQSGGDR